MQWGWDAYVGGRARQAPLITVCTIIIILSHHLDPRWMWRRNHASPWKPPASAAFQSDSRVQPRRLKCPPSYDGDLASGGVRQWCLHHPCVHHSRVSEDYGDMVVDGRRRAWKPPCPHLYLSSVSILLNPLRVRTVASLLMRRSHQPNVCSGPIDHCLEPKGWR